MNNLHYITEARPGLVIQHKLHDKDPSYDFEATVMSSDKRCNELYVIVQNSNGHSWSETWNLAHTNSALSQGEYIVVADNGTGEDND